LSVFLECYHYDDYFPEQFTELLLQNCIDLGSGELGLCVTYSEVGNEVIHVQVEGISDATEEENQEPMTSSLIRTDPGVGVMSVECVACFIGIQSCLSVSL
jgi:hypothetical protein